MEKGRFSNYDEILSGVYVNAEGDYAPLEENIGRKGIVAIATPLPWGDNVTRIKRNELYGAKGRALLGDVNGINPLTEALAYANEAIVYRQDTGGKQAKATIAGLGTVTAKYAGVAGNKINIEVKKLSSSETPTWRVMTYFDATRVNTQDVKKAEDIANNTFVNFELTEGEGTLTELKSTPLVGGENGTVAQNNKAFIKEIVNHKFDVVVVTGENALADAEEIINEVIYKRNRGIQVVTPDCGADNRYITQTKSQGYRKKIGHDIVEVSADLFPYTVGGIQAGLAINKSATYMEIKDAVDIVNPLEPEELEEAVTTGYFCLTTRVDDKVVVEKDINSLHTHANEKVLKVLRDNKTIRVEAEIRNYATYQGEVNYIGKVNPDEADANQFKITLGKKMEELSSLSAIRDYDFKEDIQVIPNVEEKLYICRLHYTTASNLEKIFINIAV